MLSKKYQHKDPKDEQIKQLLEALLTFSNNNEIIEGIDYFECDEKNIKSCNDDEMLTIKAVFQKSSDESTMRTYSIIYNLTEQLAEIGINADSPWKNQPENPSNKLSFNIHWGKRKKDSEADPFNNLITKLNHQESTSLTM